MKSPRECLLGKALINWETGCWEWVAGKDRYGYGRFRSGKAHRAAYELIEGPIPSGLQLDHLCRNRACVNPAHLEPVTFEENQRRSPINFMLTNAAKTHCDSGHEFTPENTRMWRGHRFCKACNREAAKRYKAANPDLVRERNRKYKARKAQEPKRSGSS